MKCFRHDNNCVVRQEIVLNLRRKMLKSLGDIGYPQLTSQREREGRGEGGEGNCRDYLGIEVRGMRMSLQYFLNFLVCLKTFIRSCRRHKIFHLCASGLRRCVSFPGLP